MFFTVVILLLISVTASGDASSTTLSTFKATRETEQSSSPTTQPNAYRTDTGYTPQSQTSQVNDGSSFQQTTQMVVTASRQITTSHKSTVLKTSESMLVTVDSPETAFPTEQNNTIPTALENKEAQDVAGNPGLIAVLCIFFIVVAAIFVIILIKAVQSRRPHFERLDDLPMGKINEDAPFAHYPPK